MYCQVRGGIKMWWRVGLVAVVFGLLLNVVFSIFGMLRTRLRFGPVCKLHPGHRVHEYVPEFSASSSYCKMCYELNSRAIRHRLSGGRVI